MKTVGKIIFILFKIAGILASLSAAAVTYILYSEHKKIEESDALLINYDGQIYEKQELLDNHILDVKIMGGITIVVLVFTILLFVIGVPIAALPLNEKLRYV